MKTQLFIAASLLTLLVASCSNENIIENNDNEATTGKAITLNATIVGASRMTYEDNSTSLKFNWSDSESFNLYQGTSSTAAEFTKNEAGNTFTGTAPTGGEGSYYAVYGNNITNTNGELTVDISTQTGTIDEDGITHFMVAETENLANSLSFSHKLAVLKLNLTLPESETTVKKVSVSGMHNKTTYTLNGGSYAYDEDDKGTIKATNGDAGFAMTDHKITAYIAVFPETVAAKAVSISVVTDKYIYVYTFTSSRTLTAGKVVPVNITMTTGYEYVDLGLPSGTLWATMNVDATSTEDYGDFYAWGETESKEEYTWNNYLTSLGGNMSSYNDCGTDKDPLNDFVNNNKSIAGTEYDVAHVKWGGTWQMPTKEQLEELCNEENCSREWVTDYKGDNTNIAGWILTSKSKSNTIFLPAAGFCFMDYLFNQEDEGYYRSATPDDSKASNAYILDFSNSGKFNLEKVNRHFGYSVRPVSN